MPSKKMFRQQQTEKHKVVCATMIHTEVEIDTQSEKKSFNVFEDYEKLLEMQIDAL